MTTPVSPESTPAPRHKGIYVLPNLITLAALFGGFYAIVMSMNGRFDLATLGIFAAMVLDSLDGRVARLTNTQSAFGEQMDSLSDMVSFGAAPALIAYEWVLGLPSPAAAALVAGFIWVVVDTGFDHKHLAWATFGLTLYAGLTMVTNVPFYSFKDVRMKKSVPFAVMILLALGIAVINIHPPTVLFGSFIAYGLSGYALYIWRRAKGLQTSLISTSTEEPDEAGLHD
jgi:CDP-diacylglycerol---serine O-phosphatidyltransferase